MFFTSCSRPGGVGRCDIWYTTRLGDKWSEPQNIGRPVNSKEWESQPSISADGVTIYFASNRPGGLWWYRHLVFQEKERQWGAPINLGPQLTRHAMNNFHSFITMEPRLYFTSEGLPGMGKSDIFLTRLINNNGRHL